ncbi:hypothetical protein QBC35DRAFT_450123 [Podospora australis]|uniref:CFEM domain-containing protein n=1 Tax=Podospora australis TaxID=1536484 RepID=A0AAN7AKR6_9PEZI|nr:hypothetical protein QBC35DRAFT_450123 [Podospora australis]
MWTVRSLALLAISSVAQGLVQDLQPCGQTCWNNVKNQAATYSCGADDIACLCAVEAWGWGIHDCASQDCPPGYKTTVMAEVNSECASRGVPFIAAAAISAKDGEVAPPTTPATTEQPAPTETPTEQPTAAAETSTTEALPETTNTEVPSSSATTFETSTTAPATATEASHTASETHSSATSSTAAGSAATSEAPAHSDAPSGGLPEAAKIGIGVGVGAAVLALLGVGVCIFLRNRHATKKPASVTDRYNISPPMPSKEQHPYMHNNSSSEYDLGNSELKGIRYDDMTEGQQPRQMV